VITYPVNRALSVVFLMIPLAPRSTLFPYTTLFRSTLAHEEAAGDYLSRVMSIYQLSLLGSAPLGAGFAGVITGQFGVDGTLLVLGGLTVVAAVAGIAGSGLWRLSRWAP